MKPHRFNGRWLFAGIVLLIAAGIPIWHAKGEFEGSPAISVGVLRNLPPSSASREWVLMEMNRTGGSASLLLNRQGSNILVVAISNLKKVSTDPQSAVSSCSASAGPEWDSIGNVEKLAVRYLMAPQWPKRVSWRESGLAFWRNAKPCHSGATR